MIDVEVLILFYLTKKGVPSAVGFSHYAGTGEELF